MSHTCTLVDWSRIHDLLDELGADDLSEIIDIFLEDTAVAIAEIRTAPRSELPDRVHSVKGSANNLGFQELGDLCRKAEWSLARGEGIDLDEIERSFEQSCEILLSDLPDQIKNSARVVSSVMSV